MHHLTVFGAVSGLTAIIPAMKEWDLCAPRPQAEKLTLNGGMIRQFSSKQWSLAKPALSMLVDADQADILDAIDRAGGRVYVADGWHVYEAVIDARVGATDTPYKRQVNVTFGILRRTL